MSLRRYDKISTIQSITGQQTNHILIGWKNCRWSKFSRTGVRLSVSAKEGTQMVSAYVAINPAVWAQGASSSEYSRSISSYRRTLVHCCYVRNIYGLSLSSDQPSCGHRVFLQASSVGQNSMV